MDTAKTSQHPCDLSLHSRRKRLDPGKEPLLSGLYSGRSTGLFLTKQTTLPLYTHLPQVSHLTYKAPVTKRSKGASRWRHNLCTPACKSGGATQTEARLHHRTLSTEVTAQPFCLQSGSLEERHPVSVNAQEPGAHLLSALRSS